MIYWETVPYHGKDNYDFTEKGRYFKVEKLKEVQKYGRKRLLCGCCLGWYIENTDGTILEKHTDTII